MAEPARVQRRASLPRDGEIISVVGSAGSGKTTAAVRILIREVVTHWRRALVFDPSGDVLERATGSSAARERLSPQLVRVVHTEQQARAALRGDMFNEGARVVVFQAAGKQDIEDLADEWVGLARDPVCRGFVLFADEADEIFPQPVPRARKVVVTLARNRQHTLILTTQRPQDLAIKARQNTKKALVFRADGDSYIDPGCSSFGYRAWFEHVSELQPFEYVFRGPLADAKKPLPKLHAVRDPLPW